MFDLLQRALAVGGCVLLCIACSLQLQAQTIGSTATISGRVLDQSGTVVSGAAVTIKNDLTGVVTTASADSTGRFSVPGLAVGTYTIEVALPGFKTARSSGLQVTASGIENVDITLSIAPVSQEVTVSEFVPLAATLAPSQSSLDTHSAQSVISPEYIQNFTAPTADYTEILQMAPGTFAFSPNGPGLSQAKTFFRGFNDGKYTMTFDGIPFEDTNDPTHHSWAFFPGQFIGQTVFDRSPGTASTIGPTNFGGSINMMSHILRPNANIRATVSYGSFNTKLVDASADTGQFGPGGSMSMLFDLQQLRSDGYLSYNYLKRNAFSAKYQYRVTPKVTITAFTSINELKSNTPDTTAATRAQIAKFGDKYLLTNDPSQGNYYGYNFYHIPSDFDYVGVVIDAGHGWVIDTKGYTYRYYNKQNLDKNFAPPGPTSAVDKLNSYRRWGNLFVASRNTNVGIFRTGTWSEYALTNRFQYPTDPRSWLDTPLPNFHEHFHTTSLQPYVEFEWRPTSRLTVTPGTKFVWYRMFLTQFADNGKTVGNLNGAASVAHTGDYNAWQPTFDVNYKLQHNWSAYAQFAAGTAIPPSSVFDVKNGAVAVLPKPTKSMTYQIGSVYKTGRFTLDVDAYHIGFDNTYTSTLNTDLLPVYYSGGTSTTKGVEAESTVILGAGLSLYLNGTVGSARYDSTHLWLANAPGNTETAGLSYQRRNWDIGFFNKRIGKMWNDNGGNNQAIPIDPFEISNVYFNYTIRGESTRFAQTRLKVAINNVFDQHSVVGVTPNSSQTNAPDPGDLLTKLAARSVSFAITFGVSPGK
jgi:iron complex outermembrane receptor protein